MLNINLSILLYGVVLVVAGLVLLIVFVWILAWLLLIPLVIAGLIVICIAAATAGPGESYVARPGQPGNPRRCAGRRPPSPSARTTRPLHPV